jgi:peptide/nickel transport system ATP-binding protein
MTDLQKAAQEPPVLSVRDLRVTVRTQGQELEVLGDVGFELRPRQTLGLVGESGSGKSMTAFAVMGLLARNARVTDGQVLLGDVDLLQLDRRQLSDVRGRDIGMIYQEARRSLNPAFTVGDQIAEVVRRHQGASRKEARKRAVELLDMVRIPRAAERVDDYPHMFSGGMCQRVMLAVALACQPKVLIADEPTTALDVTVQASVLSLLHDLQDELGMALLLITHDLGVVADICDDVAVMYAGRIVERATVDDLFLRPAHPYTEGLLGAIPNVLAPSDRFVAIPGNVPPLDQMPEGCRFHPRCPYVQDRCTAEQPPLVRADAAHGAACVRVHELDLKGVGASV